MAEPGDRAAGIEYNFTGIQRQVDRLALVVGQQRQRRRCQLLAEPGAGCGRAVVAGRAVRVGRMTVEKLITYTDYARFNHSYHLTK